MRHREGRLVPVLLVALAACGPQFTSAKADLDAASNPGEAGSDGSETADAAPPVADGLLLWLRADVGVTESGGAISIWADQSGNHLDARQVDPTRQPSWAAAGLSGHPAVMFNAEDALTLPNGFADFTHGVSLFAVAAMAADVEPCIGIFDLSNGPENDDIELGRYDGRGAYEVLEGVLSGSDFPLGRPQLISVVHDDERNASMRFNGGGNTTATFDLPKLVTRRNNTVGRSLYANCGSVHGGVAELLIYRRALDESERGRVESQLQSRWACCR